MFDASPVNTPSMLCVLDAIDSAEWMEKIGGLKAVQKRIQDNAKVSGRMGSAHALDRLSGDRPAIRSKTSICFRVVAPEFVRLPKPESQTKLVDRMT
jgi:phosphoserine aminotransferase